MEYSDHDDHDDHHDHYDDGAIAKWNTNDHLDGIDNKGRCKKTLVFYGRADRKIPGGFLYAFPISIFVNDYHDDDDSKNFFN